MTCDKKGFKTKGMRFIDFFPKLNRLSLTKFQIMEKTISIYQCCKSRDIEFSEVLPKKL
jgi:hypothetical protein